MSSPFFPETLKSLIGFLVGIFSNDGALIKGTLVDIKKDYLILQNKEGKYIYHHLSQIRSVSKNAKDIHKNSIKKDYLQAEQLHEILEQCRYSWITVNCYNDQFVTGMLSKVFDDHLILISEEEQIIMQKAFISNVYQGAYEGPNNENAAESTEIKTATQSKTKQKDKRPAEKKAEKAFEQQIIQKENAFLEEEKTIKQRERKQSKEFVTQAQTSDLKPSNLESKQMDKKSSVKTKKTNIFDKQMNESETTKTNAFDKRMDEKSTAKALSFDKQIKKKSIEKTNFPDKQMTEEKEDKTTKISKADLVASKRRHSALIEKDKKEKKKFIRENEKHKLLVHLPILDDQENGRETVSIVPIEEIEQQLESQYYSLMKQAEKKYMTLRKKRMEREMMND